MLVCVTTNPLGFFCSAKISLGLTVLVMILVLWSKCKAKRRTSRSLNLIDEDPEKIQDLIGRVEVRPGFSFIERMKSEYLIYRKVTRRLTVTSYTYMLWTTCPATDRAHRKDLSIQFQLMLLADRLRVITKNLLFRSLYDDSRD